MSDGSTDGGSTLGASTTVRRATRDDRSVLARLRREWAGEQAGEDLVDPTFDEIFGAWFDREFDQRLTWLAFHRDTPVGMLNMLVFTRMPKPTRPVSRWGYVANVYVDAGHRDAGVGAMMLDAAVDLAREQRFARLVLSPGERSVPFYERAGFAPATSLMVRDLS